MTQLNNSDKLQKKVHLLESELRAIKSSRSYRLVKTAAVAKNKVKHDPAGITKKLVKTALTNPRRILRIAKGSERYTAVAETVNNRLTNYHNWIALQEPSEADLTLQRKASSQFKYQPLISIITPVFDPPADVFEELIESVLAQTYPYFELCLGNFGKDPEIKKILDQYAAYDDRIKVYEFIENKGISHNSNALLEKVEGEYVALLDHDDTLSKNALYENVVHLNENEYDFLFSDKDMIDEAGNRYEPLFKPALSPEMMLSANYLTHFDVMRTDLVKDVGGWDPQTDGAQDWDLFLKLMIKSDKIAHIPKILYHWRVIATSTAHSIETKPYALAGQRRAVQKYLDAKGIQATPRHEKTELLLQWEQGAVDQNPFVFIMSRSLSETLVLLKQLKKSLPAGVIYVVLHEGVIGEKDIKYLLRAGVERIFDYSVSGLATCLRRNIEELQKDYNRTKSVIFIDDAVHIPTHFNYENMAGWITIEGVAAVGAKLLDSTNNVTDCGGILSDKRIVPIFQHTPPYYQGYLGNVEWVRNLKVVSRKFFIARLNVIDEIGFDEALRNETVLSGFMLQASKAHRLVFYPKAVAYLDEDPYLEWNQDDLAPIIEHTLDAELAKGIDRYANPNLHRDDPMHLNTDSLTAFPEVNEPSLDAYQHDALILSRTFDITAEEIEANHRLANQPLTQAKTVGWVVPSFDAVYAGLANIFGFASYLHQHEGLATHIFILTGLDNVDNERNLVIEKFPWLKKAKFIGIKPDEYDRIPKLDIGICTQWATAYPLARARNVKRKCYFIQDKELNFYPMGSISALVDLTYQFGFFAIANTPGLLDFYKKEYTGRGVVVKSKTLVEVGYDPDGGEKHKKPYRVFFYGRPNMPRNAFELGLAGLRKLKERLGDEVDIIAAGANWDPATYGANDILRSAGQIPYGEVADFYRSLDVGLMFMFSGHPGVVASELMASGCPVVVNNYNDITWNELYQHEKTCLMTIPTASEIARNLQRALEDQRLRKRIIAGGLKKVTEFYSDYDASLVDVLEAIKKG